MSGEGKSNQNCYKVLLMLSSDFICVPVCLCGGSAAESRHLRNVRISAQQTVKHFSLFYSLPSPLSISRAAGVSFHSCLVSLERGAGTFSLHLLTSALQNLCHWTLHFHLFPRLFFLGVTHAVTFFLFFARTTLLSSPFSRTSFIPFITGHRSHTRSLSPSLSLSLCACAWTSHCALSLNAAFISLSHLLTPAKSIFHLTLPAHSECTLCTCSSKSRQ